MDVLLVVSPWLTRDGSIWHGVKGNWPPLGLLCLAAYAEARGHSVQLMDAAAEQLTLEQIEQFMRRHRPRIVGLTSFTIGIDGVHSVADNVKRVSPDSKVVVGGAHATAEPEDVLKNTNIDYVIRGEGERPFASLIEGDPVESIPGLSYRKGAAGLVFQHNPVGEPIADLDSLPLAAYHLSRFELYRPAVGAYRRLPCIAMMISRGCPGKCTFCSSAETGSRTRSAENVVDEIEQLVARYGIREINFYDDTFTIFKQNVTRLCDLIVERGIDVTWSCFARTDCVTRGLMEKMYRAGCHQIMFGIESADPQILKNIRKPIDLERTREACRLAQEVGINVRAAFMLGNPGETVETMRRTIEFAKKLEPDIVLFNITVPVPGTQLYDWAKRKGYLRSHDWRDYDGAVALLELPTVSSAEVNRMYRVAYREFYLRPRYLWRRLARVRTLEDVKMSVRALGAVLAVRSTKPIRQPDRSDAGRVGSSAPTAAPRSGNGAGNRAGKPVETIRFEESCDWDRNAEFYRTDDGSPLMFNLAARRDRYYDIKPGQRVLDLGCGSGATVARLRDRGVDVVGVDYSSAMIEVARKEYGLGDHVRCADATDLPFETNSFDVVLANGVLHHLAVQQQLTGALPEIRRVLRPGGKLCCFDRNGSLISGAMTALCIKSKEAIRVATRRKLFPSCASRNEISFGGPDDLHTIEEHDFKLTGRRDVSTLPFFLSVVVLNAVQYFVSEPVRRFAEDKMRRPITWIDSRCNWRWFSVEQFAVFESRKQEVSDVQKGFHPRRGVVDTPTAAMAAAGA